MRNIGLPDIVAIVVVLLLLFRGNKLGPAIQDLFRGGPTPPSHPLPGDDSVILNRRRPAPIREL
jgi:hypothetical protein